MIRIPILTLLIITICALGTTQAQSIQKVIPSDASFVIEFNPSNLDAKAPFKKLSEIEFMRFGLNMMMMAAPQGSQDILNDPGKYGMNLMGKSYIFGKLDDVDNMEFNYALPITDKAKFSKFVQDMGGESLNIENKQGYQFAYKDDTSISWNDAFALITSVEKTSMEPKEEEESWEEYQSRQREYTDAAVKNIYGTNNSNSILSNAGYQTFAKEAHDISYWVDYSTFMQLSQSMNGEFGNDPMMSFINNIAMGMTEGMVLKGGLDFNDGVIALTSGLDMEEEMRDLTKGILKTKFNKKFLNYLSGEDVIGYYSFGFNMENMFKGLEEMYMPMIKDIPMVGGIATGGLDVLNIALDEDALYDLFKGDMLLAVTGLKEFETTVVDYDEDFNPIERTDRQTLPLFNMMLSHGDDKNIQSIINLAESASTLVKENNYYKIAVPGMDLPMDLYLTKKDGILFFTNDQSFVSDKLRVGFSKDNQISKAEAKMLKKKSQVFHLDLPKLVDAAANLQPEIKEDPMTKQMMKRFSEVFSDFTITADRKFKDTYTSEFSFNFEDKDRNSLEQLFNYFNEIYLATMGGSSM